MSLDVSYEICSLCLTAYSSMSPPFHRFAVSLFGFLKNSEENDTASSSSSQRKDRIVVEQSRRS